VFGVASISRIDQIIGLLCKRALLKRQDSAKETYNLIEPTDCSHPICICKHRFQIISICVCTCTSRRMCKDRHRIVFICAGTCTSRRICTDSLGLIFMCACIRIYRLRLLPSTLGKVTRVKYVCVHVYISLCLYSYVYIGFGEYTYLYMHMGWLRLVGSFKL